MHLGAVKHVTAICMSVVPSHGAGAWCAPAEGTPRSPVPVWVRAPRPDTRQPTPTLTAWRVGRGAGVGARSILCFVRVVHRARWVFFCRHRFSSFFKVAWNPIIYYKKTARNGLGQNAKAKREWSGLRTSPASARSALTARRWTPLVDTSTPRDINARTSSSPIELGDGAQA